jgi:hypothetical protein
MALFLMNILCRGCRTEMDLNASTCPICLRTRDRSEMLEDAKALREGQAAAKRRPFVLLGWAAVLGALGWAGWTYRGPVGAAISSAREKAGAVMDHASDPKTYAPAAQPLPESGAPGAPPAAPSGPGAPAHPSAPGSPAPASPGAVAAPLVDPIAAEEPHDFTPLPLTGTPGDMNITLYGWVYDVATAKPVPGAAIRFRDRMSGNSISTNADYRGWYELQVPRENSGLTPEAAVAGYRRETLAENEPAWHQRKAASRKKAAAAEPDEVLLTFTPRQEEAQVNIVLVPRPK